jgi:hypothetical protein
MPSMSEVEFRYPYVAAWLNNADPDLATLELSAVIRDWNDGGAPDQARIRLVQRAINDEQNNAPTAPCEAWHQAGLPNGDYETTTANETFRYRLYLVQSGQLAGQRIVKVKHPDSNVYKGFAFLNRDGSISLWRRFADDARAQYVQVAAHLFQSLSDTAVMTDLRVASRTPFYVHSPIAGVAWVVGLNVRCSVCNETCNGDRSVSSGLCAQHLPSADRIAREQRESQMREQNQRNERARLEQERRAAEAAEAARNIRPGRRTNALPMCEVTGRDVQ